MKLKRLAIQSLPGIEKGFVLDEIDEKVNLVTGANGIGKSSLIRALRYLLNETNKDDPTKLDLSAILQGKEDRWEVQRFASGITWKTAGKITDRPQLPKYREFYCYWLTLEDLLLAEQSDKHLVAELKRSLNGGFDLAALRKDDVFKATPRQGWNESKNLSRARKALKSVNAEYDETRQIEEGLPSQQEKVRVAKGAKDRTGLLQNALNLLEASKKRVSLEESMAEFPEHLDQLTGDEIDQLESLEKERRGILESKESHQTAREKSGVDQEKTGLAADLGILSTLQNEIDTQNEVLNEITLRANQAKSEKEKTAEERVKVEVALEILGGSEETVPKLDPESLSEAQGFAREYDAALNEKERLQKSQGIGVNKTGTNQKGLILIGLGGLIATGAGFLAQVWPAVLGGSIVLAAALWIMFGTHTEGDAYRQEELKKNESSLKTLEKAKKLLAQRLGFDPSLTSLGLLEFTSKAHDYHNARVQQRTSEGRTAALEAEINPLVKQVHTFFEKWGTPLSETARYDTFRENLKALKKRKNEAEEATRKVEAAENDIERDARALKDLDDAETTIYNKAEVEPGNLEELKSRCDCLPEWHRLKNELSDARATERDRNIPLQDHADLLTRVSKNDHEGLASDLEQAEGLSEEHESLNEALIGDRTRLNEAGNDQKLEEASAAEAAALTKLDVEYQKALIADTAEMLLDAVQEQHRNEHEPKVLKDARQLFLKFTHHKFELDLDEDKGFTAKDLKAHLKPQRNLFELSSATRMQLLLAMRVAWTLHLEQGREPLPLFLDEALTTADHERFGEVARTLEGLAKDEGRQIFYLCARQQEADYWEHATGKRPHHIDLNAVRSVESIEKEKAYPLSETTPIPRPTGLTPEEYAKILKVPAIDLRQSVEGIHIFHLLRDDLDLLHDLIEGKRITTLGQFESWLKTVATSDQRDRLQGRSAVAGLWTEAWTQGRGKLVDRIALEIVDTPLIDLVSELADSLNGEGTELIASLRERSVSGFGPQRTDSLEKRLEDNGYIDSREQLDLVGRERFVHMGSPQTGSETDTKEIVRWLEAGHKEL